MAPKRRSSGYSTKERFDSKKFINSEAAKRFDELMVNKGLVPERGISLPEDHILMREIVKRGWEKLTKQPDAAVVPIVREFYANAVAHNDSKAFVRGKWVPFDASTINKFYGLKDIEREDDNIIDMTEDVNLHALTQKIAINGAEWAMRDGVPCYLNTSLLRRDCRVWHSFIGAKLMPTTHFSTVHKERALMIYDIVSGKNLDVGDIIAHSIIQTTAQTSSVGLGHPHLITCLCLNAGVKWGSDEELLQPTRAIDISIINMYKRRNADTNGPRLRASSSRRGKVPISDVATRVERLEKNISVIRSELRQFYTYAVDFNSALARVIQSQRDDVPTHSINFPVPPALPHEDSDEGVEE